MDEHLLLTVMNGDMPGAELVLMAGACIDGGRHCPTRPLVAAAQWGHVKVLEMLIGRGADLEIGVSTEMPDDNGVVGLPLGSRALHGAVTGSQVGSVRSLLKAHANPDVINSEGLTPLMMACHSPEIVKELLKGGACPTFANSDGTTALHKFAFFNGLNEEAMGLLIEAAPSMLNQVCSFSACVEGATT